MHEPLSVHSTGMGGLHPRLQFRPSRTRPRLQFRPLHPGPRAPDWDFAGEGGLPSVMVQLRPSRISRPRLGFRGEGGLPSVMVAP